MAKTGAKNPWYGKGFFGGKHHTDYSKKQISLKLKGKTYEELYGMEKAIELKDKRRLASLGKYHSEETINKIRVKRAMQKLPLRSTSIEIKLWEELERRNIKFKKNYSILFGRTIPDAFIEPNICLYADGDYWHNRLEAIDKDKRINKLLLKHNYMVYRFWEHEINNNVSNCVDKIILPHQGEDPYENNKGTKD